MEPSEPEKLHQAIRPRSPSWNWGQIHRSIATIRCAAFYLKEDDQAGSVLAVDLGLATLDSGSRKLSSLEGESCLNTGAIHPVFLWYAC